ncbi:uncharacterized protein BX663DRAFT_512003, partial [Cokeromyces recurvatus]|uniref:uncharacterized protein n=1 Tax=Cokeromyces recurvatus TaxID=90255 RepID=UPI00221F656B
MNNNNNKKACPHCRQVIYNNKPFPPQKRLSSPPVLPSGRLLSVSNKSITTENNNDILLDMIMKLKAQLDEEKQCRLKLEKVIQQQQRSFEKREVLAKEKDKWANDRLWLNDRISFLLP